MINIILKETQANSALASTVYCRFCHFGGTLYYIIRAILSPQEREHVAGFTHDSIEVHESHCKPSSALVCLCSDMQLPRTCWQCAVSLLMLFICLLQVFPRFIQRGVKLGRVSPGWDPLWPLSISGHSCVRVYTHTHTRTLSPLTVTLQFVDRLHCISHINSITLPWKRAAEKYTYWQGPVTYQTSSLDACADLWEKMCMTFSVEFLSVWSVWSEVNRRKCEDISSAHVLFLLRFSCHCSMVC